MPLKAVFFDIDGTLVDSNEFHVMAWDETFHKAGFWVSTETIRTQIGKGADQIIPFLLPAMTAAERGAIADRHGEIFRTRYLELVKPFPNATDLIELLHSKGKKVVLASSADRAEVDFYVELLKIGHALNATVSNDDVKSSKPAGDIFAASLASVFPLSASETLAVGDTKYDVESAFKSDVKTIAVRSGGVSEEMLFEAGAAYVFASVKDLFDNYTTSPLQD